MNTPPTAAQATSSCTATVTQALLADGWTYVCEVHTHPVSGEVHQLASPDGYLELHMHDVSRGLCFVTLTARTRGDKARRFWNAQIAMSAPIALAVISAARQATSTANPDSIEPLLAAAGWHERHDDPDPEDDGEGGPLIRTWAAPDGTRSVTWFGPDDDPAFWSIDRPALDSGGISARLTHHTPAHVIAAAALTA